MSLPDGMKRNVIDGHAHMDREGLKKLIYPSLAGCASIADIQDRIAALARLTD